MLNKPVQTCWFWLIISPTLIYSILTSSQFSFSAGSTFRQKKIWLCYSYIFCTEYEFYNGTMITFKIILNGELWEKMQINSSSVWKHYSSDIKAISTFASQNQQEILLVCLVRPHSSLVLPEQLSTIYLLWARISCKVGRSEGVGLNVTNIDFAFSYFAVNVCTNSLQQRTDSQYSNFRKRV